MGLREKEVSSLLCAKNTCSSPRLWQLKAAKVLTLAIPVWIEMNEQSAAILVAESGADMTPEEYLHERHLLQLERFPHCVPLPGVMVSVFSVFLLG